MSSIKRKSEGGSGARFGDILEATSIEQRAWIGAVVLAYNDAESALHRLAGACLQYAGPYYSVTSRINGTDGLIAIIQEAVASIGMPQPTAELFNITIANEGFAFLKTLRDSVIHAELFDSGTGIGVSPGKRGKRQDVVLTPEALEGLYHRLKILRSELSNLETVINCQSAILLLRAFDAHGDQRLADNEQDIQDAISLCKSHQSRRQSLLPFPKFPDPPKVHKLLSQWVANPSGSIKIDMTK